MMASSTQFYITLPSNSSLSLYPDNTLSSYTTRLVEQINLTGNWEVAMTEIHFPFTWYNITDKNNSFTYSEGGNQQSICTNCTRILPVGGGDSASY